MKTIPVLALTPSTLVAGKVHRLWRYLDRLASAWEYASDKDLQILDTMLCELEREIAYAGQEALPPDFDTFVAAARCCLDRARGSRSDLRMRHLESAGESVQALLTRFPTSR